VPALRQSAGTRLYAETHDREATARHLGHTKLETTRMYATWSDRHLRETIGRWSGCGGTESGGKAVHSDSIVACDIQGGAFWPRPYGA
jgi:hypothetical protein